MNIYKLKLTVLQQEILRFLFIKSGLYFTNQRIAKSLEVSPAAVLKSLKTLERAGLIKVVKDKDSKRLSIEMNRNNQDVFYLKRAENLKLVYESGLFEFLSDKFPGATIILFGSYSFAEDTVNSDIDIAIICSKSKEINLSEFEKLLERKISLNFYNNLKDINKNLKENILNGIVLKGAIQL
jgi:DNA-binding MarR family transcriptional regulator